MAQKITPNDVQGLSPLSSNYGLSAMSILLAIKKRIFKNDLPFHNLWAYLIESISC